jgi:hypothetical protein
LNGVRSLLARVPAIPGPTIEHKDTELKAGSNSDDPKRAATLVLTFGRANEIALDLPANDEWSAEDPFELRQKAGTDEDEPTLANLIVASPRRRLDPAAPPTERTNRDSLLVLEDEEAVG